MKKTLLVLASAAVLAACSGKPAAQAPVQAKAQPAPPQVSASSNLVTGRVAETMNAAGYTYVRVATESGDRWAAVQQTPVKVGDNVTIVAQMVVPNFESQTLKRKFDNIIFGTVRNGAPASAGMTRPAEAGVPNVRVEKAEGGKTIAEVWAGKNALKDKPVVIRGTVVKFLPDIMGKNWMHLRDGSGTRAKGDDDITVTTSGSAKVGDVVIVTGTLRVDQDFGSGYEYGALIEDAKIKQ